jgi:hypothetical protein
VYSALLVAAKKKPQPKKPAPAVEPPAPRDSVERPKPSPERISTKLAAALEAPPEGYNDIFKRLRTLLRGYATRLRVAKNDTDTYELWSKKAATNGSTMYFGGVRLGKKYVSYHLFPVYVAPKLLEGVSPALKKRMQGKSCFNFEAVDDALFEELAQLTQKGFETFEQRGMI